MRHPKLLGLLALSSAMVGLSAVPSSAQSCVEPTGSAFRTDTLLAPGASAPLNVGEKTGNDAAGPVQMAITPDGRVFIAKMETGEIRVWKPGNAPGVAPLALKIPTYFSTEDGLLGIAVDPKFATTNWIYAFFSDPCGLDCANRAHELARFTVSTVNGRDTLINKKVILRIPRARDNNHHAAGGIAFDRSGVIIIGTGDNTTPHDPTNNGYAPINWGTPAADAQRTSSNSNDLRGKILRIKPLTFNDAQTPTPGEGTTYSIPAGNLWEKISDVAFNPQWNPSEDTLAKVRKEIFTMGHRNPYHPRVDDLSGWIFFGEIGPDNANNNSTRGTRGYDEWNLTLQPGFFGHPYCNGKNQPWASKTAPSTANGTFYDCEATGSSSLTPMKNMSPNNTGIRNMPRARPPIFSYALNDNSGLGGGPGDSRFATGNESSIGGPMYRYDTALASTGGKFPPYYEGKIFWFDWARAGSAQAGPVLRWLVMNPNGTLDSTAAAVRTFSPTGLPSGSYIDAQFGPEGALYLLKFTNNQYSGAGQAALYRVRYTGTYDNSCFQRFTATVGTPVSSLNGQRPALHRTLAAPALINGMVTLPIGYRSVELFDLKGRQVWSYSRELADRIEAIRVPQQHTVGVTRAKLVP